MIAVHARADRAGVASATAPTVAVLLALSANRLDEETLERFVYLVRSRRNQRRSIGSGVTDLDPKLFISLLH